MALAWDVELLHSPLDLNGSAIVVGAGRPAAGSVLLERPAAKGHGTALDRSEL